MKDLHDAILSLPCTPHAGMGVQKEVGYEEGHRDARHAAAELAMVEPSDSEPNAEWLTTAHLICADAGIAPGHISDRLRVLRDRLSEQATKAQPADELTDEERLIIRRALSMYGTASLNRANEIAQDKTGETKVEWVGIAQDEGNAAYVLINHPLIARAVLAAQKARDA